MTTVTNVTFYDHDPTVNGFTTSGSFLYSGPATATGAATIADSQSAPGDLSLEDVVGGGTETATADISINGHSSTGVAVFARDA